MAEKKIKSRGHFFGVDQKTYHRVCALNDPDIAASYLILAAGTAGDNRITSWSREAINKRTSLTWRRARDVIDVLIEKGFARWLARGARPRLELIYGEPDARITPAVQAVMNKIAGGYEPDTRSEIAAAARARDLGLMRDGPAGWEILPTHKLVWLPKAFVEWNGVDRPPVERVRKGRDAMAFRLLVDMYGDQDLAEKGGTSDFYYKSFERTRAGSTGAFNVWDFGDPANYVRWEAISQPHLREPTEEEKAEGKNRGADIFARFELLHDAGALEWVYYLVEDEGEGSPLIHPVAVVRHGKIDWNAPESIMGSFALRAGNALVGVQDEATASRDEDWMHHAIRLPAERVLRKVQLRAIPRLRYRAQTSNAARWLKQLMAEFPEYIEGYRAIIEAHAPALLAKADNRLADFNGTSTYGSTVFQRDLNVPVESAMHMIGQVA